MGDDNIKYSDSQWAPEWAKKLKEGRTITSFGKPLPKAEYDPRLDARPDMVSSQTHTQDGDTDKPFKPTVEQIEEILWQETNDDVQVYCIMDGYWADGLYGRLLNSPDLSWAHMFQGDVATRNVQQAPFIIALKRGHKLTKWLIEEGWGQGWGIYFTASTYKAHLLYGNPRVFDKRFLPSNEEQLNLGNLLQGQEDPLWKMRRHFRRYSDVYLESENKIVDFRYYDPKTLETYIINCTENERKNFFLPINNFISEYVNINIFKKDNFIITKYFMNKNSDHKVGYNIDIFNKHINYIYLFLSEENVFYNNSPFLIINKNLYKEFEKKQVEYFLHKICYAICINIKNKENYDNYIIRLHDIFYKLHLDKMHELYAAAILIINFFSLSKKYDVLNREQQELLISNFLLSDLSGSLKTLIQ